MGAASTQGQIETQASLRTMRRWVSVAVEFALAMLLQIAVMDFHAWTFDESLLQYGALRAMHGLIPYRDFWTLYPPGGYYTLAAAFRVFGVNALSGRIMFVVSNAISTIAIIYLLDRLTERWWLSRLTAAVTLLWLCAWAAYAFPVYPSIALILVATAFMVKRWESARTRWTLGAGVALGLSALYRHDLAIYALVALGGASVTDALRRPKTERAGFVGADVVRLCWTAGLVVLPVAVWLLAKVPGHDLYFDMIYFPGAVYAKVRSLPFPTFAQTLHGFLHPNTPDMPALGSIEYNVVWLPVLAALAAVPLLVSELRKRRSDLWKSTAVVALTLMTALLFLKGVVRVAPVHMVPGVVAAFVLLAVLWVRLPTAGMGVRIAVLFVVAWAGLCALASVHTDYLEFRHNLRMAQGTAHDGLSFAAACHPEAGLQRAKCVFLPNDEKQAILFLESESVPSDSVFVGQLRYDVMRAGDVQFYFYSDREAATRWYDLEPAVETTAPIQNEMVCDIERNRTRYIVRDDTPLEVEPNASRIGSGVNVLGQFIERNYVVQQRFGQIDVLVRATPFAAPGVYCNG